MMCMYGVMLHGSDMWSLQRENELALNRTEIRVIDGCMV